MSATRDQRTADEFLGTYLPCAWCGNREDREALGRNGARCGPCYAAYLGEIRPRHPVSRSEALRKLHSLAAAIADRNRDPKDWAKRLRHREESGERLHAVQASAWRIALGVDATQEAA